MPENTPSFLLIHRNFLNLLYEDYDYTLLNLLRTFFGETKNCILLDRTETIIGPAKMKLIYPIPEFDINFNKTFKTICEDAARNIIDEGKPIDIFWSGGIDSTLIVVSFLNVCKDLSQINIIFEKRSIDEYPLFYNNYIKQLKYTQLETYIYKNLNLKDHSVVTGHPGGLLVGQYGGKVARLGDLGYSIDETKNIPWKDVFDLDQPFFDTKEQDNFFVDKISIQIKKAPFNIESISDLKWWLGFSTRWQDDCIYPSRYHTTMTTEKLYNLKPFFSTVEFQQWAMWNYYTNIKKSNEWLPYKGDYKQIIYDFTNDEEYYLHKGKINSGSSKLSEGGRPGRQYMDALDEDYNIYNSRNISNEDIKRVSKKFANNDYSEWTMKK